MLPDVCSLIDHRWRQNVVRTKKWQTRHSPVCHWCSYHILTSSVIYYWIRRWATWNLFVLYSNEKPFLFQNISTQRESRPFCPAFAPPLHEKKLFDVIYDLHKMKQFYWLLCVAKNCDWSRKIAPLSNLTRASLLFECNESRIELRNLQILKEMLEKASKFLSSEQPREPKSLDLPWKLQELKNYPRKTLWLRST